MDESFTDLEDSFQHQVSLLGKCDAIITLNVKDFKNIDPHKNIVFTPNQFIKKATQASTIHIILYMLMYYFAITKILLFNTDWT